MSVTTVRVSVAYQAVPVHTGVVDAEETASFKERRAVAERRAAASRPVADGKRAALLVEIEQLTIKVPDMPRDELVRLACASYDTNATALGRDYLSATPDSAPDFLYRIMVNYLRHECTAYDSHLAGLFRRVGKGEAADAIREKVYDAIADTYPELAPECNDQLERRRRMLDL